MGWLGSYSFALALRAFFFLSFFFLLFLLALLCSGAAVLSGLAPEGEA